MKYFVILLSFLAVVFAEGGINPKFNNPVNCKGCHKEQFEQWETSLHAISHEGRSELYKESVKYVSRSTHKPYEQVVVECGKCHNPRMEVKDIDGNYMLAKAFDVVTEDSAKVDTALKAKHVQNGIACYVCHNTDQIHPANNSLTAGYQQIKWTENDTIVGPFEGSHRASGFHKGAQREFFISNNDLCLICHEGQATESKFSLYATGSEAKSIDGGDTLCTSCHMKPSRDEVISPEVEPANAIKRLVKTHNFAGARNSDILTEAMDMSAKFTQNTGVLTLQNTTPHKVPTGFSGRSIVVEVTYSDGKTDLKKDSFPLRATYADVTGQESLSYNATELRSDTRLAPLEIREIKLELPKGTKIARAVAVYYVIAPELLKNLPISDDKFTKRYELIERVFDVK